MSDPEDKQPDSLNGLLNVWSRREVIIYSDCLVLGFFLVESFEEGTLILRSIVKLNYLLQVGGQTIVIQGIERILFCFVLFCFVFLFNFRFRFLPISSNEKKRKA